MDTDFNFELLEDKISGIKIEQLNISNRLCNCLKRGGYDTLSEVMATPTEAFFRIRNFGKNCEQEVLALKEFVLASEREEILAQRNDDSINSSVIASNRFAESSSSVVDVAMNRDISRNSFSFVDGNENICNDIDLAALNMSVRSFTALKKHSINSLREVAKLPYKSLINMTGLGKKSINELLGIMRQKVIVIEQNVVPSEGNNDRILRAKSFLSPVLENVNLSVYDSYFNAMVMQIDKEALPDNVVDAVFVRKIVNSGPISQFVQRKVMKAVDPRHFLGVRREELVELLSKGDEEYYSFYDDVINSMLELKQLRLVDNKICEYKLYLSEWIDSLDDTARLVVEGRCNGLKLEQIGQQLNVTRERVRQRIFKELKKRPSVYEDDFRFITDRYDFTIQELCSLLNLKAFQVRYLKMVSYKGSGDVQKLLNDEDIPEFIRERIPVAFKESVVLIDGECVLLKRDVLVRRLIKAFASERECSIDEFALFYSDFLQENGISSNESLCFSNNKALEARLSDYPDVLMQGGHKVRYYDSESVDINELLREIDVLRYINMEISTLKFVRDCPDVMEKYDIRDEYELHNLLRKQYNRINDMPITILRMPFVSVGVSDRTRQVEDLLLRMAPVGYYELAREYEKQYGVRAETVLANFFKSIDIFYHDGIFSLDQKNLTTEEYQRLSKELVEDFYLWDEIVNIYTSIFGNKSIEAINSMTLKRLGFKVYSQYVVRASYISAEAFFTRMLLGETCLDLNLMDKRKRSIQTLQIALANLRNELELIEIDDNVFYRFDVFSKEYYVTTKEELYKISRETVDRIETKYYSIDKLCDSDIIYGLPQYTHNPYILYSLVRIDPRVRCGKIANVRIGTYKENELSLLGLISFIVKQEGEVRMVDLINKLCEQYGVEFERSRVLYIIENSNRIKYDAVFDFVCDSNVWKGYEDEIRLENTRFSTIIERNRALIEASEDTIATVYWQEKNEFFVEYCAYKDCFKMKDLLKIDFQKIYDYACKMSYSRGITAQIAETFVEWTESLTIAEKDKIKSSIMDMFFK